MERTNIYLETRQTEALDRLAAEEGVSRAEIIRRFLDRALAGPGDDLAADLAAIGRSFGALQEIDAADREPGARDNHLARLWETST